MAKDSSQSRSQTRSPSPLSPRQTASPYPIPSSPGHNHVSAAALSLRTTTRRERNRIASQKCRARKTARLTYLEGRVAELEEEVRVLRAALGSSPTAPISNQPQNHGLTPQPTLPASSFASSSMTSSLASVQSSSLASISSTSSTDTLLDSEQTLDSSLLKRENEELKACMRNFEREWNAAINALGIHTVIPPKPPSLASKESSSEVTSSSGPSKEAQEAPGDTNLSPSPSSSTATIKSLPSSGQSQPLSSLATLLAAARQLPPV